MYIEQSKLTDNVVKNLPNENHGVGIENYFINNQEQSGFFPNKTEDYSKKTSNIDINYNAKMANATYQNPCTKDDTVNFGDALNREMIMTAETSKNQMIVASNTMTPEDYKKMQEDGFTFDNSSSHTIITESDQIKAALAKAGVDITAYGDGLSKEQLEEITGSAAVANQIEQEIRNQMSRSDIPETNDNIEESKIAYNQAMQIKYISDSAISYLIKNDKSPTISNIYKAQFSSQNVNSSEYMYYIMSEQDIADMSDQVSKMLVEFGIVPDDNNMQNAFWLINNNIEFNSYNINYFNQLKNLSVDSSMSDMIIESMVESIYEGERPGDALLIPGYSLKDRAEKALDIIEEATYGDVYYVINAGKKLNINNLEIAENIRKNNYLGSSDKLEIIEKENYISSRRILEEVRLIMTSKANYSLLKRGISIDTKPLEMLVEDLKQQEKQYYADLLSENGVQPSEENINIFSSTVEIVEQTKWQPAYAISLQSSEESITVLNNAGEKIQAEFSKVNQRYETMMTVPRADLGDNINKAFRNIDDILEDLNIEISNENQRAVRILAYNEIEINIKNIYQIKAADSEIQRVFDNMTPAVVLQMIKKGIQPLDISISELNDIAVEIKSELGDENTDKFSKFLWKLEKDNKITEEERTSYIGVYRLFAQIEKADRAAIGSLINQGVPITMRNLLTSIRSKNKGNIDYEIDDDFAGVNVKNNGEKIDDQIMAAYNYNCIKEVAKNITPEFVSKIIETDWENLTPEQLLEKINSTMVDEEIDIEYSRQELSSLNEAVSASEDVYRFLERYDIQNNVANVIAASRMMRLPGKMFGTLFNEEEMSYDQIEKINQIKEQILDKFSEAIKTPKELAEAQEQLAEIATHAMDNMIIEDKSASFNKIKELKMACKQIRIASQTAKSESFVIPIETGEGITGVSLKVIRGEDEKGLIDIFFNTEKLGNVAASFEAKEQGITGVIATDSQFTVEVINTKLNLAEMGDIKVAYIKDISSERFQASSLRKEEKVMSEQEKENPVQTKRLYKIAESFIKSISTIC